MKNQPNKKNTGIRSWTLFGAGYFIYDIIDAIESRDGDVTKIVLNQKLDDKILENLPKNIDVINFEEFEPITTDYFYGFMEQNKKPLLKQLENYNIHLSNVIHSFSYIAKTVLMGEGNFIGAGAIIAPKAELGNFNIINRGASLSHDLKISDLNNIGPGVTISGMCKMGSNNLLGSGSTILPCVTIGDHVTVGAGGVLTKDAAEPGVYVGIPAKKRTY